MKQSLGWIDAEEINSLCIVGAADDGWEVGVGVGVGGSSRRPTILEETRHVTRKADANCPLVPLCPLGSSDYARTQLPKQRAEHGGSARRFRASGSEVSLRAAKSVDLRGKKRSIKI